METLLSPYLSKAKLNKYILRLKRMGLRSSHPVRKHFPRIKETGVDIAIDPKLFPWILEVYTRPDPYIFKSLKDKRIYRKIFKYAKTYGRFDLKPLKHSRR